MCRKALATCFQHASARLKFVTYRMLRVPHSVGMLLDQVHAFFEAKLCYIIMVHYDDTDLLLVGTDVVTSSSQQSSRSVTIIMLWATASASASGCGVSCGRKEEPWLFFGCLFMLGPLRGIWGSQT